jgi:hypothetical protein
MIRAERPGDVTSHLQRVRVMARRRKEAEAEYLDALQAAKTAGHSYAEIGLAAGLHRATVHQRMTGRTRKARA